MKYTSIRLVGHLVWRIIPVSGGNNHSLEKTMDNHKIDLEVTLKSIEQTITVLDRLADSNEEQAKELLAKKDLWNRYHGGKASAYRLAIGELDIVRITVENLLEELSDIN
jgi:hypothetical protein